MEERELATEEYEKNIENEMIRWIRIQEELELDVLVHGEFERTDMVEYFGEKLEGFAFTKMLGLFHMVPDVLNHQLYMVTLIDKANNSKRGCICTVTNKQVDERYVDGSCNYTELVIYS